MEALWLKSQGESHQRIAQLTGLTPNMITRYLKDYQTGGIERLKEILVENPHEILVDKLCSLLGRSEIRDLEDVRVLLEAGGELERALRDAPRKDAGFSPLTLAWVLRGMDVAALADLSAWDQDSVTRLIPFRDSLVRRITDLAEPR